MSSIGFGGLASGFDYKSYLQQLQAIEIRSRVTPLEQQKSQLNSQKSKLDTLNSLSQTLLTKVKAFTDATSDNDVFTQKKASIADSDANKLSASITNASNSYTGNLAVKILAKATSTVSRSSAPVANYLSGSTALSNVGNGSLTYGNFSVDINGVTRTVTVTAGQTVGDVLNSITSAVNSVIGSGTTTTIDASGKITVSNASATNINFIGKSGDTSNFNKLVNLNTANFSSGSITSTLDNNGVKTSGNLEDNTVNFQTAIAAGSQFRINGVSFSTTGKSLDQLISDVNSSSANVTMTFDSAANRLQLTSKSTGNVAITTENISGNFLAATGLASPTTTAGANAQFQLNGGSTLFATTNDNIDLTQYGYTGVNISLKDDTSQPTVNITIGSDTSAAISKVQEFTKAYNDLVTYLKDQTNSKSTDKNNLSRYSVARNLLQSIRSSITGSFGSGAYTTLGSVGVSTSPVSGTVSDFGKITLDIDTAMLSTAISQSPTNISNLFKNILGGTKTELTTATQSTTGSIAVSITSVNNNITRLSDSITRTNDRIDAKIALMTKQFEAMEQAVSRARAQASGR